MPKRRKEAKGQSSGHDVAPANVVSKDIDDIFAKKPVMKPAAPKLPKQSTEGLQAIASAPTALVANELANVQNKVIAARATNPGAMSRTRAKDDFADIRGTKKRKRTSDGLTLYQEDELRIGQGGDTSLCPFDCDCCF